MCNKALATVQKKSEQKYFLRVPNNIHKIDEKKNYFFFGGCNTRKKGE